MTSLIIRLCTSYLTRHGHTVLAPATLPDLALPALGSVWTPTIGSARRSRVVVGVSPLHVAWEELALEPSGDAQRHTVRPDSWRRWVQKKRAVCGGLG